MSPTTDYPTSQEEVPAWAEANQASLEEAWIRLAQYGVLLAISSSRSLSRAMALKGGNALDFIWHPNRSTSDLDFSILEQGDVEKETLASRLSTAVSLATRQLGIAYRVQKVERKPANPARPHATYQVKVGYALPHDRRNQERFNQGRPLPTVIKLDISINEIVCASSSIDLGHGKSLQVCDFEDIIAEKLRSLLQQITRKRNRCQDLLDLACIIQSHQDLDRARIRDYLLRKAAGRQLQATCSAFENPAIWTAARVGYDALESTVRHQFVPYPEACVVVQDFIATLGLPE